MAASTLVACQNQLLHSIVRDGIMNVGRCPAFLNGLDQSDLHGVKARMTMRTG
jgi:hypothetical protein